MDQLVAAHAAHVKAATASTGKGRVQTKSNEPTLSGMPFSELVTLLGNEKVTVPAKLAGEAEDKEMSLLGIFMGNAHVFSDGVQSNWERDTAAGYLYHEVGLRLLPYGLVQFDKLPAAQAKWFKRLVVSPEGHKLLLHYKRVEREEK